MGLISGQWNKILHAAWCGQKIGEKEKKKKKCDNISEPTYRIPTGF